MVESFRWLCNASGPLDVPLNNDYIILGNLVSERWTMKRPEHCTKLFFPIFKLIAKCKLRIDSNTNGLSITHYIKPMDQTLCLQSPDRLIYITIKLSFWKNINNPYIQMFYTFRLIRVMALLYDRSKWPLPFHDFITIKATKWFWSSLGLNHFGSFYEICGVWSNFWIDDTSFIMFIVTRLKVKYHPLKNLIIHQRMSSG